MRSWVRCFLVAFISWGMLNLQIGPAADAAEVGPTAVVASADRAHISALQATTGATVFPGDLLDTELGGELRLIIGRGQVYLLSATAATLGQQSGALEASVERGTIGFSALTARQFELRTPEGTIRAANGLPAHGQVTITGPRELIVSAYDGSLLLVRNDQKLMIAAGQSYDVALVADSEPPSQGQAGYPNGAKGDHLVWKIIVVAGAALAGYLLWRWKTESPIDP